MLLLTSVQIITTGLLAEILVRVHYGIGDRRVYRERDPGITRKLPKPFGELVAHPERAFKIELAGAVAALEEKSDCSLGTFLRRNPRRPDMQGLCHHGKGNGRNVGPSGGVSRLFDMSSSPSRIDLLELDIDLRLADLWREAAGIGEWSLEVVAAFMRADYERIARLVKIAGIKPE